MNLIGKSRVYTSVDYSKLVSEATDSLIGKQ